MCGVFEVHGGKITLWRDYLDFFDVLVKAPLRALVGLVVPSLSPDDVALRATELTEFVERLRPSGQPIGGAHQLVAIPLR